MAFTPYFHSVATGQPDLKSLHGWRRSLLMTHDDFWSVSDGRTLQNYDLGHFHTRLAADIAAVSPDIICLNLEGPQASWYYETQGVQTLIDSHQMLTALAKAAKSATLTPVTTYRPPLRVDRDMSRAAAIKTVTNRRRLCAYLRPDGESPFDHLDCLTGEAYLLESWESIDVARYAREAANEIAFVASRVGLNAADSLPWVWGHRQVVSPNPEGSRLTENEYKTIVQAFKDAGFAGVHVLRYAGVNSPRDWQDGVDGEIVAWTNDIAGIS